MDKETQDKLWAVLTEELRKYFSNVYFDNDLDDVFQRGRICAIKLIFGEDNLIRGDVQMPGEFKPRFKEGDKVMVIAEGRYKGLVTEITYVDEEDDVTTYQIDDYEAFFQGRWFSDSELEPYTEESNLASSGSNVASNVASSKIEDKEIDWEQRRYEVARDLYANSQSISAEEAIEYADALIYVLKSKTE